MSLGIRVLRGPDWDQKDVDGGEGHLGTVVGVKAEEETAEVVWDNGQVTMCRVGKEGKHDLRILDNAPCGVEHLRYFCNGCQTRPILGIRWQCRLCVHFDLCTLCYVKGLHDLSHDFDRVTKNNDPGTPVGRRSGARQVRVAGIFPGARVTRGRDWESGDVDGGAGGVGTAGEVVSPESGSARNAVRVSWDSGQSLQHRLGLHGKVDLVLNKESPAAPPVYIDHLPVLTLQQPYGSGDGSPLREGDSVVVVADEDTLQQLQKRGCGWSVGMKNCVGKTGIVKGVSAKNDVDVDFGGQMWRIDPKALKKTASKLSAGDIVRVLNDPERVKQLQEDHGGWVDDMQRVLGKVGRVRRVSSRGDLHVKFGQQQWRLNPLCCQPAPDARVQEEEESQSLYPSRGRREQLAEFLNAHMPSDLRGRVRVKVKDTDEDDGFRRSKLCAAVASGDLSKVKAILGREPELLNERVQNISPLHVAAYMGETEIACHLLDKGANLESPDPKHETPLLRAVSKTNFSTTKLLLERGADVNATNDDGRTSLHKAASRGRADLCRLLLQHGASTNRKDMAGYPPTVAALERGDHSDIIEILLIAPDLNLHVTSRGGVNVLHYASHVGRPRSALLIARKDPSMLSTRIDNDEWMPIHMASAEGHTAVVRSLIEAGSGIDVRSRKRITPLQIAASKGNMEIVKILLEKGADIDAQDADRMTPLHRAVFVGETSRVEREQGRLAVAKHLILQGANMSLRNRLGQTAMEQTNTHFREILQRFLEEEVKSRGQSVPRQENYAVGKSSRNAPLNSTAEPKNNASVAMITTCRKCCKTEARVIYLPCAHKVACLNCAHAYSACPQCRNGISARVDIDGKKLS